MTVQELGLLHRRYVDLSASLRSLWAFHHFLHGVEKVFAEGESADETASFEELQGQLKDLSRHLNAAETDHLRTGLDEVDGRLDELKAALRERDATISPQSLRLFFQRVKKTDAKILTQLLRFYVYSHQGGGWEPDRLDKVDYLAGRLSAALLNELGPGAVGHRERLREISQGLWDSLEVEEPEEHEVDLNRHAIEEVRLQVDRLDTLDQWSNQQVVKSYRQLKHGLENLFFHPRILAAILETNRVVGDRIRQLYGEEERRIVQDYHEMFEVDAEAPADVDGELAEVHEQLERFEQTLDGGEAKLEEVGDLLRRVNSLLSVLQARSPRWREVLGNHESVPEEGSKPEVPAKSDDRLAAGEEFIASDWEQIVAALRNCDHEASPKTVCLDPQVFPFRLEPREVVAFRHLDSAEAPEPGKERFLLEAAALRVRIQQEAEELKALADSSADVTNDSFSEARDVLRLADTYVRRFGHLVDQAVLDGELGEAQHLQVSRMRLWRDYANIWLLTCKPSIQRNAG
jgi:hypothetical protein